jgi:hypothetical protein
MCWKDLYLQASKLEDAGKRFIQNANTLLFPKWYGIKFLKVVSLILTQYWSTDYPHSAALYIIVYSFIRHIHYNMFWTVIAAIIG